MAFDRKEYDRRYYQEHKAQRDAYRKAWRADNLEKDREYKRRSYYNRKTADYLRKGE